MGVYKTSGDWVNGCTFRVCPDESSVLPNPLGPKDAKKLWGMGEDEFLTWLDVYTKDGLMTQDRADKTMDAYFKRTLNAYSKED